MRVNPYLTFNGNCEEAFKFYAKVLNAKIDAMLPHAGTPAEEHVSPEWRNKIMHACMSIGDTKLMASDAPSEHFDESKGISVALHPKTPAEAERIFSALSEGGTVKMPIQETFWATRFGMLTDRFGTPWMINCDKAA
jgi:PhnB protein